ncbi:MAG TPA: hypothetical protein VIO35_05920 [Chloroflexota bacterium]
MARFPVITMADGTAQPPRSLRAVVNSGEKSCENAFSTALNGDDPSLAAQHTWTFVRAGRQLEGAQVIKGWDPSAEWAAHLATVCHIPAVCATPEACAEDVDAVIVVDDGTGDQEAGEPPLMLLLPPLPSPRYL